MQGTIWGMAADCARSLETAIAVDLDLHSIGLRSRKSHRQKARLQLLAAASGRGATSRGGVMITTISANYAFKTA